MSKNIIFLTNLHLWSLNKGKGGPAFINTVEGYKSAGWKIWFISTGGAIPDGLIENDKLFVNSYPLLDKLSLSGFKLISVICRFLRLFLINQFFLKNGVNVLKSHRSSKFIIYSYEVDSVYAGKKLSNRFNFPFVTRFQGTVHAFTPDILINRIRKAPHFGALKTSADLTIMTNDGTLGMETLRRLGNKSKEVLFWRNGVDFVPELFLNKREEYRKDFNFDEKFVFITVSRLENWKRVDRAIIAFSFVQKKYPNSLLLVLGDGAEKDNLMSLTKNLGLLNSIHFLGAIEQSLVKTYIIASDAFLSFYDLSNVGNPLMEAMMCGKSIITLDVGETSDLIKNNKNGILLSLNDLDKIPEMMGKLITDIDFSKRIGIEALNTAHLEFWNWDDRISAEIRKVDALFDTCLS
jgi:glycosyltransferase involved in cell wall biosynthesis